MPKSHTRITVIVKPTVGASWQPPAQPMLVRTRVRGREKHAIVDSQGRLHMMVDQGRTWAVGWTSIAAQALESVFRLSA